MLSNKIKIKDLTYILDINMPVYPYSKKISLVKKSNIEKNGKETSELSLSTHTGTHIDSPSHVIKGGKTIENISIDKFMGRAKFIDISNGINNKRYGLKDVGDEISKLCIDDILIIKV